MNNIITIQFEWIYNPADYFNEVTSIECEGVQIQIKAGRAIASIKSDMFYANESIADLITKKIKGRFLAVLLLNRRSFQLSEPCRTDIRQDGSKNYWIGGRSSFNITLSGGLVCNNDTEGKNERFCDEQKLADRLAKYAGVDDTLEQMLKSFQASIDDSENELVHLYEVRDALAVKFVGKTDALKALGISEADWSAIGKLSNELPLKQGRHRGKHAGSLRDAQPDELEKARTISFSFIAKYLEYLDARH